MSLKVSSLGLIGGRESPPKMHCACVPGIKLKTHAIFNKETEYPEMHAVIGTTVSLPCNLSPPSPDDSFSLVLWYRLDLPNPIYTLDARSATAPGDATHFANKVLGGRARFNISTQRPSAASLTLENVQEDDAGEYRCRVDFKRGRTLSWLVKLNVIVPTNSLVIKDKDNKTLSGTIGPIRKVPHSLWFANHKEVGPCQRCCGGECGRRFQINSPKITCQASNTNLTAPVTASVKLDISLNPTEVHITTPNRPCSAGERIEVVCVSKGSRPPAKISWWKDGKDLKRYATEEILDDVTTSKLFFTPSSDDNEKTLTCRAENPVNADSALEDQWVLNVYYAPIVSISFTASQQNELIREGSDVHLECNIQANPPAADIRWRFHSKAIPHDPSKGIMLRNNTLIIQNVQKVHRGRYRCLASNLEGESISDEVLLRVQFAPVCASNQKTTYGIARHEEANVSCAVEADPPEVAFRWSFNNTVSETIDILSYSSDGASRSVARYIPRTRLDYGALYCFAKNAVGIMKEPCVFTIIPTGPPEPVQNCSVTNTTLTTLTLACDPGDDGGLPQTFHLEVYSMLAEQLIMNLSTMDGPLFIADKLSASSSYLLVSYASNAKGRSMSVALTAHTQLAKEQRTNDGQPVTISTVLVVLMGTVGALVLLAIIIIFIMKARGDKQEIALRCQKVPPHLVPNVARSENSSGLRPPRDCWDAKWRSKSPTPANLCCCAPPQIQTMAICSIIYALEVYDVASYPVRPFGCLYRWMTRALPQWFWDEGLPFQEGDNVPKQARFPEWDIVLEPEKSKNEDKASEEKTPSCSETVFEGKQTDLFSKNYQTEYVDLTPNTRTERIYESLGDCKEYTYENVIHKSHFPPTQFYENRLLYFSFVTNDVCT
ncbi:Synaptogenesis protein syg-2 like protein [Argiope bruennichi]|uniref:Synaptogenesis protein syg-2 like protein n=1 Tax=Argiope bruennichi TaxID=94029 RepID=A0A8T0FUF6_ARGBR|nr:Synaptogenesis protein syg-2 like protein [Argiope bruennichi]